MAPKKIKKNSSALLTTLSERLDELHLALGRSVIIVGQTKAAIKKGDEFLRVNAFQLRDSIRELEKRRRAIFADLTMAGVLDAESGRKLARK